MMNEFTIEQVSFKDAEQELALIRSRVFIEEQQVPAELEWDGLDRTALHLLARTREGNPVATARMLPNGHIGRMAVLQDYRGKGIGYDMLQRLINIAVNQGLSRVWLNAQSSAIGFYEKAGFHCLGAEFMDAGIPHRRMVRKLP